MAGLKASTWRGITHSVGNAVRNTNRGIVSTGRASVADVNSGIDEWLREDIPVDETEEERLDREAEEQQALEDDQYFAEMEQQRIDDEREAAWQAEQERILEQERMKEMQRQMNGNPGGLKGIYQAVTGNPLYQGYVANRNLIAGTALMAAGTGAIAMSPGLAMAAAPAMLSTGKDIVQWAHEKLKAREDQADEAKKKADLAKAEAQASIGTPEDARAAKAAPGTPEYNNIKAKEKTRDQVVAEADAASKDASSGKVDPEYVNKTADDLVKNIRFEEESAFNFEIKRP